MGDYYWWGARMLMILGLLVHSSNAFCPDGCACDEDLLHVTCVQSKLEVMPMTLNPSIKTLILKLNDFHSVDASFHFYPELTLVDLSSNELVNVPDRAFGSQRKLEELRLGGNKLSELTEKTFSGLSRLQSLDLSHNFLETLDNRVFKPLRLLKELNLESNRISEVEMRAFAGCSSSLVSLNLGDNLLKRCPPMPSPT